MATRRSQRIAIKGAPAYIGSDVASDDDCHDSRPAAKARRVDTSPPTEKYSAAVSQKKAAGATRAPRKRGKLHQILDMPLDVLMEIASQMQTREMLYLSRLSKAFRAFFTSRSTQFIWTAARENVPELPPLPEDLNEMQYASLLYDTHCHRCMSKNCHFVYWACRIRLCKRCFQESAINLHFVRDRRRIDAYHLYDSTTSELLNKPWLIDELLPALEECQNNTTIQYKPSLDKLLLEWKALTDDETERKEWMEKRKEATTAQLKSEPALQRWYEKYRTDRADELSDVRHARKEAIMQKLEEEGWHLELKYLTTSPEDEKNFSKLPEVRKSQALTPRIWNSIKEPVEAFMQDIRDKRLHEIYMDTFTSRLKELDTLVMEVLEKIVGETEKEKWEWVGEFEPYDLMMCVPELVRLADPHRDWEVKKEVKKVTRKKVKKVKEECNSDFNVEQLRPTIQTLIYDYFDTRQAKAEQALATALRETFELDDSVDPFTLAVGSYFACTCDRVYTLPNVLHHAVCHTNQDFYSPNASAGWTLRAIKPEWMPDDYFTAVQASMENLGNHRPWMWNVEPFRAGFEQVKEVVSACGFEVGSATVEDLDRWESGNGSGERRLICTCHIDRKNKYVPVMSWRTAAFRQSCCRKSRNLAGNTNSGPVYKVATTKQAEAVKESEAASIIKEEEHRQSDKGYCSEFACAHCSEPEFAEGVFWKELRKHLQEKHDVSEPREGDWRSTRKDEAIPNIVYLVSHKVKDKNHSLKHLEETRYGNDRSHLITYFKFPTKGWP